MTDWTEQLRTDAAFARHVLMEQGSVAPMFVFHCPYYTRVMGAEWSTVREKRLIQRIVALHAAAEDAEAISFVSEAWVSSPRQGPDESDAAYLRRVESMTPSEDPERHEVLITTVVYREGGKVLPLLQVEDIVRDHDGSPVSTHIRRDEGVSFEGLLAELLSPRKLTMAERTQAKKLLDSIIKMSGVKFTSQIIHPEGNA